MTEPEHTYIELETKENAGRALRFWLDGEIYRLQRLRDGEWGNTGSRVHRAAIAELEAWMNSSPSSSAEFFSNSSYAILERIPAFRELLSKIAPKSAEKSEKRVKPQKPARVPYERPMRSPEKFDEMHRRAQAAESRVGELRRMHHQNHLLLQDMAFLLGANIGAGVHLPFSPVPVIRKLGDSWFFSDALREGYRAGELVRQAEDYKKRMEEAQQILINTYEFNPFARFAGLFDGGRISD